MLAAQLERTANPDRKAQFAFVRPALSADAPVRDAWFASLGDPAIAVANRGCSRACDTFTIRCARARRSQYIATSLDMLVEIQRTGDIFFPKRWMDATLGGYQLAVGRDHRAHVPRSTAADYPDRLRRIILSSADDLFRAAR